MTDAQQEAVIGLAMDLISRPSVTPEDGGCQSVIAERLSASGFSCESLNFGNVSNLWARYGNERPLLCFAGHTDVVPPGPLADWATDPFEPAIVDGHLFGRGAADMKGSLAAMVVAAEQFVHSHPTFNGSLCFLVTSDEEGPALNGTRKVIETLSARKEKIDWCVVGEPSSSKAVGDCIRVGRRGSLTGDLRVSGVQGHVAYPQLADNPIRRFAPALAELHTTAWDNGTAEFPPTSFEVVQLDSGAGADNVTPSELHARFNFRYSTCWTGTSLAAKVEQLLRAHDIHDVPEWILSGEPFLTGDGRLTRVAIDAIRECVSLVPVLSTGGGTSDGRFIAPSGAEVVEIGPCNASIHKVNENVNIAELSQLSSIFARMMELLLAK